MVVLLDVGPTVVVTSVVGAAVVVFFLSTAGGSSVDVATDGISVAVAVEEREKYCSLNSKIKSNDDVSRQSKYK